MFTADLGQGGGTRAGAQEGREARHQGNPHRGSPRGIRARFSTQQCRPGPTTPFSPPSHRSQIDLNTPHPTPPPNLSLPLYTPSSPPPSLLPKPPIPPPTPTSEHNETPTIQSPSPHPPNPPHPTSHLRTPNSIVTDERRRVDLIMASADSPLTSLNGVIADLRNETLRTGSGDSVALRPKTFAVLRYLVGHAGRLVTKDELMQGGLARTSRHRRQPRPVHPRNPPRVPGRGARAPEDRAETRL